MVNRRAQPRAEYPQNGAGMSGKEWKLAVNAYHRKLADDRRHGKARYIAPPRLTKEEALNAERARRQAGNKMPIASEKG